MSRTVFHIVLTALAVLHCSAAAQELMDYKKAAENYFERAVYDSALAANAEYESFVVEVTGEDSPEFAAAKKIYGDIYYKLGNFAEAEEAYKQAVELYQKRLGQTDPDYARAVSALAGFYNSAGDYARSEQLYKHLLRIKETQIGKQHPSYAVTLNNLAEVYKNTGRFTQARSLYQQSIDTWAKTEGTQNYGYALRVYNLGVLYHQMGMASEAGYQYDRVKAMLDKLGFDSPLYSKYKISRAMLSKYFGDYQDAEQELFELQEYISETYGRQHPDYAKTRTAMANLFESTGRFEEAEEALNEALQIYQPIFGEAHPRYALAEITLANLNIKQGKFQEAEELYLHAKEVIGAAFGKRHPFYATILSNLAGIYTDLKRRENVEDLLRESISIIENHYGKNHSQYAVSITNLGSWYLLRGFYDEAEELFREALNIWKRQSSSNFPLYAKAVFGLAKLYKAEKRYRDSELMFDELLENYRYQVDNYFPFMSETERTNFYNTLKYNYDQFYSLVVLRHEEQPGITGDMYNNLLFTKSILFNSSQKVKDRILGSGDNELIAQYNEWFNARGYLAKLRMMAKEHIEDMDVDIDSLQEAVAGLEKNLALKSADFADTYTREAYTWQDVRNALAPGEAAVEMASFRYNKDTFYAALIITPNTTTGPALALFPNGEQLEEQYYKEYADYVLGNATEAADLYSLFWKPVAEQLGGANTVYFAPEGVYHRINLHTLYNMETGKYLLDETDIRYVTNTKDILGDRRQRQGTKTAELYGAPEFYPSGQRMNELNSPEQTRRLRGVKKGTKKHIALKRFALEPLPASEKEVEVVSALLDRNGWETDIFTGTEALEGVVKATRSPGILHIATHGYFEKNVADGNEFYLSTPLSRAYLFFTGAGTAMDNKEKTDPEYEDGILTAEEVMNLHLEGTSLVVLSACETGLGEIAKGEGVYGLQRAFRQAGAQSVLMSLWDVEDDAAFELMSAFYRNWLGGSEKHVALRDAMKTLRRKSEHPFYWGAFILVGL